jgi:hypothetical protein
MPDLPTASKQALPGYKVGNDGLTIVDQTTGTAFVGSGRLSTGARERKMSQMCCETPQSCHQTKKCRKPSIMMKQQTQPALIITCPQSYRPELSVSCHFE